MADTILKVPLNMPEDRVKKMCDGGFEILPAIPGKTYIVHQLTPTDIFVEIVD